MRRRLVVGVSLLGAVAAAYALSGAAALTAAQDAWPTYHGDNARTGVAASGPLLGRARRAWKASVDGAVYAEPLVVGNRVLVATENDSVYAFDARTGRRLWHQHLGQPVAGGDLPCGNIDPSGITATPVIDTATGTAYVVAFEQGPTHVLVALDLASGRVKWHRPVDAPGADPRVHQERAALTLASGRVYVAYGGLYGDCGDYHGRVVAVRASDGAGLVSYKVPTQREGGIWAPSGPVADSRGNLYVATGNGSSGTFDYGNAVIELSPALQAKQYFSSTDAGALNASDTDLGSTGPVLLPADRLFVAGKSGVGYLLSATRLGGIGHPLAQLDVCGSVFGGFAYDAGTVYVPCTDGLVAVRVAGTSLRKAWTQSSVTQPPIVAGAGVWGVGGGALYQLDPATGRVRFQASIGSTATFATPAAAGGRVFVAAGRQVLAFSAR